MRGAAPIACLLLSACALLEDEPPDGPDGLEVRVATLRMTQQEEDPETRLSRLCEGLESVGPDLVALQDVLSFPDGADEVDWLQRRLGFEVRFEPSGVSFGAARLGLAVASRYPILDTASLEVGDLGNPLTIAQKVTVETPLGPLSLVNVRLREPASGAGSWSEQVERVLAFTSEEPRGLPPVVIGHFGRPPGSSSIGRLTGTFGGTAPMADAWRAARGYEPGPTLGLDLPRDYTNRNRAERVDYIFFCRDPAYTECLPLEVDRFCFDAGLPEGEQPATAGVSARLLFRGG